MWLIIILIIGAIMIVKSMADKAERFASDKTFAQRITDDEERKNKWLNMVTDKELECALERKLNARDKDILKEVSNTWSDYFSQGSFEGRIFDTPEGWERTVFITGNSLCWHMALRMLMANRGKLPYYEADTACMRILPIVGGAGMLSEMEERERQKQAKHFVESINRKLIEHGVCQDVFLCPGFDAVFDFNEGNWGDVMWRPMISNSKFALSQAIKREQKKLTRR